MNKACVLFVSMFSLVLLLSVYYVSMDHEEVSKVAIQPKTMKVQADNLQEKINAKLNLLINSCNEIVANDKSNEEAKSKALNDIDTYRQLIELQNKIVDEASKQGYKISVEIKDEIAYVSIFEQEDNKQLAKDVMDLVYALLKGQYFVEVSFQ